jgi:hypothetical protein
MTSFHDYDSMTADAVFPRSLQHDDVIDNSEHSSVPDASLPRDNFNICLFNAQSVGHDVRADEICDFISEHELDAMFLTETWLRPSGDEPIIRKLTPSGYKLCSFPRPSRGGGICILYKDSLHSQLSFTQALPFNHESFEFVEVTLSLIGQTVMFACIYTDLLPAYETNSLPHSFTIKLHIF